MADNPFDRLIVPSENAPGVLGTLGITTRGLKDTLVVALGIGIIVVGIALLVSGSKTAKSAVNLAANVVPGGNIVKTAVTKVKNS